MMMNTDEGWSLKFAVKTEEKYVNLWMLFLLSNELIELMIKFGTI